jgi:hypothetical protein
MKRSEMVEKLTMFLVDRCMDRYGNLLHPKKVIHELLEEAEELGMLPPEYVINEDTPERDSFNEWEPEDE